MFACFVSIGQFKGKRRGVVDEGRFDQDCCKKKHQVVEDKQVLAIETKLFGNIARKFPGPPCIKDST